jgi:hypothetical protein
MLGAVGAWRACFRADPQAVSEFFCAAAPLIEHPETIVQISILMLVEAVEADCGELLPLLILRGLECPKQLVQYHAMSALAVVVPNYRDCSHWDIVRDAIAPLLGVLVPLAMNMAREFGISGITAMISVLIKDPVLLPGILEFAPDLVSAAFDFLPFASASKHDNASPEHVISLVLNLVRELRDQPDVQNDIGQHIWRCAIQTFDEIRGTPGIEGYVEIFNILTLNMSSLPDQIWQLIDVLAEMVPVDPSPLLCLPCSYFFQM